jgi:hypothetical protein
VRFALATLALLAFQDPGDGPVRLKWKLAKLDFARYRAFTFQPATPDTLSPNTQRPAGLFGYEIQGETRYVAAPKDDRDIPLAMAWTLPSKPLAVGQSLELNEDFEQFAYGPINVKGTTSRGRNATVDGATCVEIVHKGAITQKKGGTTGIQIEKGEFAATVHFDPALGIARRTRFTWSYTYGIVSDATKKQYTQSQNEVLEYVKSLPPRYPAFEIDVNTAIDKGVAAIWKQYVEKDGHWPAMGEHNVGPSALALLAILKGSLDRKDPRIRTALDWILAQPIQQTYDTGCALLALEAFYSPRDPETRFKPGEVADKDIVKNIEKAHLAWAVSAVKWLATQQHSSGLWHYPMKQEGNFAGDYSNTQYGVLGLFAASRMGVAVDPSILWKVEQAYLGSQQKDGPKTELTKTDQSPNPKETRATEIANARGWGYSESPGQAYGSMTLGGIGSLTILDSVMRRMGVARYSRAEQAKVALAKRDGWAWMQQNWAIKSNATYGWSWYCYYLYAMERAGMLNGLATLGGHDWYYEGAQILISNQSEAGTWFGSTLYDQAFCVQFLKRATMNVATPTGK